MNAISLKLFLKSNCESLEKARKLIVKSIGSVSFNLSDTGAWRNRWEPVVCKPADNKRVVLCKSSLSGWVSSLWWMWESGHVLTRLRLFWNVHYVAVFLFSLFASQNWFLQCSEGLQTNIVKWSGCSFCCFLFELQLQSEHLLHALVLELQNGKYISSFHMHQTHVDS